MTDEELKWIKTNNSVCALLKQVHDVLALTSLPPRREWVCLTPLEIDMIDKATWDKDHKTWGIHSFAHRIEAKLWEKNGG